MNERSLAPAARRRLLVASGGTKASPRTEPGRSVLTLALKLALLAGFALLVLLRLPEATWHGRLLGEEGPIFLGYAWHRDAWDALWRSFGGYLNLAANASTLLAARLVQHGILPLEHLPRLTMGIALVFQMLPAALILWGRGSWLTARWAYVASLLMIVLAPFSEEVWLNVLHIQFHLTLCCALILVLEPPASRRGWSIQFAILLLAPLCGPGALILGPLFLARTFLDRSPARLAQTVVLGLGGLAQMLLFFTPSPVRGQLIDLPSLAAVIFLRAGVVPISGIANGLTTGLFVVQAHHQQDLAWWMFAGLSIAFCGGLAVLAWLHRRRAAGWLIAAALSLALVSFGGGMIALDPGGWFSPTAAERYNFLPLALLGIAAVAFAQEGTGGSRIVARVLCGVLLLTGVSGYFLPLRQMSHGPNWRSQVMLWRQDHNHVLRGWPADWVMDLSDVDRPCPKADLETASMLDPTYCESAWLAKIKPTLPDRR